MSADITPPVAGRRKPAAAAAPPQAGGSRALQDPLRGLYEVASIAAGRTATIAAMKKLLLLVVIAALATIATKKVRSA
ncbi:MAG TPA: hypothetical protein VKZ72_10025 [Acidimicrobiales bacterium]|nr:hypothetical protein [Acidimicrobiales bacterium]